MKILKNFHLLSPNVRNCIFGKKTSQKIVPFVRGQMMRGNTKFLSPITPGTREAIRKNSKQALCPKANLSAEKAKIKLYF